MCRSIKILRNGSQPASLEEVEAAALQYVRKISGYRKPSAKNQEAFDTAVREITESAQRLIDSITSPAAIA